MHDSDPIDKLEKSFSKLANFIKTDPTFREECAHLQVGKYQIQEVLSDKGQAMVYLAIDPELNRPVVLKIPQDEASVEQREQLFREGRALSALDSPYVIKCIGIEEHENVPLLVLEYIHGTELTEYVKHTPLDESKIEQIIGEIAMGLHAVHRRGLLHLDLKPQNVIITQSGQVKILDFGLAKPISEITCGEVAGTWAFMSPEVANNRVQCIDQRTDIFGVGAVWFYLLTGQSPISGQVSDVPSEEDSIDFSLITKHCSKPELLKKCLHENPADRFDSVSELLEQLKNKRKPVIGAMGMASVIGCMGVLVSCIWLFNKGTGAPQTPGLTSSSQRSEPDNPSPIGETVEHFFQAARKNRTHRLSLDQLGISFEVRCNIDVGQRGQITGLGTLAPLDDSGVYQLKLDTLGAIAVDVPSNVYTALISFQYVDQKLETYCVQQTNGKLVRSMKQDQSKLTRSIGIRFSTPTPPDYREYFLLLASDKPFELDHDTMPTDATSVADLERGIVSLASKESPKLSYFFIPYRVVH